MKVMFTEKANHAYEIVQSLKFKEYDSIVSCSGDGLFHEIVNGLCNRPDWDQ